MVKFSAVGAFCFNIIKDKTRCTYIVIRCQHTQTNTNKKGEVNPRCNDWQASIANSLTPENFHSPILSLACVCQHLYKYIGHHIPNFVSIAPAISLSLSAILAWLHNVLTEIHKSTDKFTQYNYCPCTLSFNTRVTTLFNILKVKSVI